MHIRSFRLGSGFSVPYCVDLERKSDHSQPFWVASLVQLSFISFPFSALAEVPSKLFFVYNVFFT